MTEHLNEDFLDLLAALLAESVEFLVVGAWAMALHGVPRSTGDLDVWIRPTSENADRVLRALERFGAPVRSLGIDRDDLGREGWVFQLGLPPRRIDLTTGIDGATFAEAWASREITGIDGLSVPYLDRATLVRNKRASGRPKDRADLALLGEE